MGKHSQSHFLEIILWAFLLELFVVDVQPGVCTQGHCDWPLAFPTSGPDYLEFWELTLSSSASTRSLAEPGLSTEREPPGSGVLSISAALYLRQVSLFQAEKDKQIECHLLEQTSVKPGEKARLFINQREGERERPIMKYFT